MFDFDGVIADSLVPFERGLREVCAPLLNGAPFDREMFLGLFDENMVAGLLHLGIAREELPALLRELGVILEPDFQTLPFFPGIGESISRLAATHKLFVVTSNVGPVVEHSLVRHGVQGVRGVWGSDIEPSKVRKIERLRAQFPDLSPYYIGDTLGDMVEGRAGGAKTVGATWGWHGRRRLEQAAPDFLLDSPAELIRFFLS